MLEASGDLQRNCINDISLCLTVQPHIICTHPFPLLFAFFFLREGSLKIPLHSGVPHPYSLSGLLQPIAALFRIPILYESLSLLYAI